MSVAVSRFDHTTSDDQARAGLQAIRAVGGMSIVARAEDDITAIRSLHEVGGYRVKCPASRAQPLEAVMINTGGGVAGGDRITLAASAEPHAALSVTTATAERIYRSSGPATEIDVTLSVAEDATLAWLPQATILFSGAAMKRRLNATLTPTSRLLIAETTAYGRTASGEIMSAGHFNDQWRIERDGRVVFAEATRLDGNIAASLARPAVAGGAGITALLLCVAPEAEARRDVVREVLAASNILAGVSAWNGMLVARLTGDRLDHVANALRSAGAALSIVPLPAAWTH